MTNTIKIALRGREKAFAIIDAADAHLIEGHTWLLADRGRERKGAPRYAKAWGRVDGKRVTIWMHRLILGTPDGLFTDHIDGDGLNNRRCNLRTATRSQNAANKGPLANNKSGVRGVSWCKRKRKWHVQIKCGAKKVHGGYFTDIEQAAAQYQALAATLYGEFAKAA